MAGGRRTLGLRGCPRRRPGGLTTPLHVEIGGVRYAYLEAGRGPLLLFGHGTFGGKELFRPLVERLAGAFHCVSVDWPGHGESGHDPQGWGVDDLVEAVPALLDAFGERTAVLAGVSQGGAVFTRVALRHPDRVAALVTMCAGPGAPPKQALDRMRDLAAVLSDEGDEQVRRREVETFTATSFHARGFAERSPEAATAETDLILSHPRDAIRLVVGVPASYQSVADQMNAITCPVLVIWGAEDPRPELGAQVADAIPGARLALIEGAGHHVNVDAPNETADAIEGFLLAS